MEKYLRLFIPWRGRFDITIQLFAGGGAFQSLEEGRAVATLLEECLAKSFSLTHHSSANPDGVSFYHRYDDEDGIDRVFLTVGSEEGKLPLLLAIKSFAEAIGVQDVKAFGQNLLLDFPP